MQPDVIIIGSGMGGATLAAGVTLSDGMDHEAPSQIFGPGSTAAPPRKEIEAVRAIDLSMDNDSDGSDRIRYCSYVLAGQRWVARVPA